MDGIGSETRPVTGFEDAVENFPSSAARDLIP